MNQLTEGWFLRQKKESLYDGSVEKDKEKEKRNMSSESWQFVDLQLSTNFPELSFCSPPINFFSSPL